MLLYLQSVSCNNVTLGAESFQSRSHITAIIQNFTLVSLTSTVMPHPVKLPFGAAVPSHPTNLTPMYSTSYYLYHRAGRASIYKSEGIPGYGIYLCFVHLSRNEAYHPQASLDDKKWVVNWMQPDLLFCEDVNLVIGIGQDLLARWRGLTFGMSLVLVRV